MNPSAVEQLLELAGKATKRPWRVELCELNANDDMDYVVVMKDNESGKWWDEDSTLLSEENAALIVAAVNLVEPLARDWQRMREALERCWGEQSQREVRLIIQAALAPPGCTCHPPPGYEHASLCPVAAVSGEPE